MTIPLYACPCGARAEGEQPAKCWKCGGEMTRYGSRMPLHPASPAVSDFISTKENSDG